MSSRNSLALACSIAALVAVLAVPCDALALASAQITTCTKRTAKAFKRYSTQAIDILGDCQVDSLKDDERNDCALDESIFGDLEDSADRIRREVKKCDDDALRAVCPHSSRDDDELKDQVLNDPNGTTTRLMFFDSEIFSLEYAGCPRPTGEISRDAEDCADRISRLVEDGLDDVQKCLYKCELGKMNVSGADPCLEGGDPFDPKIVECMERLADDLNDGLENRCDAATLIEIGCPLDQTTVAGLAVALEGRLLEESRKMGDGIFHSSCSSTGSNSSAGGETDPVPVTLYPSETATQVDCGDTLDAVFFGSDNELKLDANLDCSPAGKDTSALVISASNVTVNGRNDWEVIGPSRSGNRTGTGIRIAPGAQNVTIKNITKVQRYAVGIADSGDNDGLIIENLTVRRNKTAGIITTSPDVTIDRVKADRNGIGFQVSGDGSTIQDSRALRSTPLPAIGILLAGTDGDLDGRVVRVNRSEAHENELGILVYAGPHLLEDNDVRINVTHGIHVLSDGSKIESNSVKQNLGSGIVVDGDFNNVTANRSDENFKHGYVVTGTGNDINNNGAGTLTDQGNGEDGFWIAGTGSIVTNNDAEANAESGFVVDETTAEFKSNNANDNGGIGFDINGTGNDLDTNVAEDNLGFEFSIAPDNIDGQGNRRNGSTFSFVPEVGGDFD